jgi:hypothetical protein
MGSWVVSPSRGEDMCTGSQATPPSRRAYWGYYMLARNRKAGTPDPRSLRHRCIGPRIPTPQVCQARNRSLQGLCPGRASRKCSTEYITSGLSSVLNNVEQCRPRYHSFYISDLFDVVSQHSQLAPQIIPSTIYTSHVYSHKNDKGNLLRDVAALPATHNQTLYYYALAKSSVMVSAAMV